MKKSYSALCISAVLLQGCYFANECGYSQYYYDDKYSFYDSQGVYHERCPASNIVNYDDIKAKFGKHNPYVYDDLNTPVPASSPRGLQALQRDIDEWEHKQAELAESQGMLGGKDSAYPRGVPPPRVSDWAFGL